MSDFELLSIVLMMLSIIVTILLAYINHKVTASDQESGYFFK